MLSFITTLKMIKTLLKGWFSGLGLVFVALPFLLATCVILGVVGKLAWNALTYGFNLLF